MNVYIISTIISCVFTYLDSRIKKSQMGGFGLIAILFPSFIAGARDYGVGTDTIVYGERLFRIAIRTSDLAMFLKMPISAEPLYRIIIFVVTRFTDRIFWQYFFIQVFVMFFMYRYLVENIKQYRWLAMYVFMMLFWGISLNIMRQSMAIFLCLWGYRYVKNHQLSKYILCVAIAGTIHISSVICLLVYPFYVIVEGKAKFVSVVKNYITYVKWFVVLGSLLIVVFAPSLIRVMSLVKASYASQVRNMGKLDFRLTELIFMSAIVIPMALAKRRMKIKDKEYDFLVLLTVAVTIVWQASAFSSQVYRVALCFYPFVIKAITMFISSIKLKSNRIIVVFYYLCILFLFFVINFVYLRNHGIYPYKSELLNII